jgi:cation transport ATPase
MNWKQNIIIAILLIMIGVIGRITLHDIFAGINNPISTAGYLVPLDMFFIVAGISLYTGVLLNKYYALVVPLCIICLTDIFYAIIEPTSVALWMTWLFLFTWSGYVVISSLGFTLKKKNLKIPTLMGIGVIGVIFYDIWTNFGFWLSYSKLGYYTQDINGLSMVYIGGLPTMLWHILSTSITIGCISIFLPYLIKNKDIEIKSKEKYSLLGTICILLFCSVLSIGF